MKKILLGSALDETLVYLGSGVSQQLRSSASHVSASTLFLSGWLLQASHTQKVLLRCSPSGLLGAGTIDLRTLEPKYLQI